MPRPRRIFIPGYPLHVIQRGNNKIACFKEYFDYVYYLNALEEIATEHHCCIHALVLMTNHIHMLVTPCARGNLSKMMQSLGVKYVHYFNNKYERTGTLWEGRYKATLIESDRYFFAVSRYIELNPVRAAMVNAPHEYRWSSYQHNAMGLDSTLFTPHELYLSLGKTKLERLKSYRAMFDNPLPEQAIELIRDSTNRAQPMGNVVASALG